MRKALLVVPSGIIAFWGYSYLRLCILVLLSPSSPVEFRYLAAGGSVRIYAESYAINLRSGFASIVGLRVEAPSGGAVAAVRQIRISQLDLSRGIDQSPVIDAYGLTGKLVRLSNGRFQLEQLLPSTNGTSTSAFPYRVKVHGANVVLADLKGTPWRQRVLTDLVTVSGAGPDWVAFSTATLPGMGVVQASVVNAARVGVRISGRTDSMRGEKFLDHVLSDKSLHVLDPIRDLQVKRATAAGPFEIFVPSNLRFSFSAQVSAAVDDVSWKKYHLDHLTFVGAIGEKGARGKAVFSAGGNRGQALGSVRYKGEISATAKIDLFSPNERALPAEVERLLPKGVDFKEAKYSGWVSYRKGGTMAAQGLASAAQLTYRDETAFNSKVSLHATQRALRADIQSISVAGATPTGSAQIDLANHTLVGYVQGNGLQLDRIGKLTHTSGLSGFGSVRALVTGPLTKPVVSFIADGMGSYERDKLHFGPDEVQVSGSFHDKVVQIRRGYLTGVDGLLAVSGHGESSGRGLNMNVEARNIQVGQYLQGALGQISLSGVVTGDATNPQAHGTVRAVDLSYKGQQVPAAAAEFVADRSHVRATRVGAVSGTMDLEGEASLYLPSQKVEGKFALTGLELAQFVGDQVAGIVDVPTIQLSGTIKQPSVLARVQGSNLVAGEVLIDNAEAFITANPQLATIDHATADFAGGSISASGTYDLLHKIGSGAATSTAFDLSKLAPALGQSLTLGGTASINEAKVAYHDGALSGSASGQIDRIVANGAPVGDGVWSVKAGGDEVNGNLSIGQIEPVLRAVDLDATYNLKQKTVSGTFDASRAHLADLISASLRYLPESWTSNSAALAGLSADLTVGAKFSGPVKAPNVSVDTLLVDNLTYKSSPLGTITASKISRDNQIWTVPELKLQGPEGSITASGKGTENGPLSATISGRGLVASALSALVPSLAGSKAVANFDLTASGMSNSPDLKGDLDAEHLIVAPATEDTKALGPDLSIKVPNFSLSGGKLSLGGTFGYAGFSGTFAGAGPLSYSDGFGSSPVTAHLTLDQKQLKDLPFVDAFIDSSRSQGSIKGDITASGPIHDLSFSGGIDLSADTLGFRFANPDAFVKRVDDEFKSVSAKLAISKGNRVALNLQGSAIRGGSFDLNAGVPLPNFGQLSAMDSRHIEEAILNSPISGQAQTKNLSLRQSESGGYVSGTIDGQTPLGGTLRSPAIGTTEQAGVFTLSNVDTVLPTFKAGTGTPSTSTLNPSFNLKASLANQAHVKSATAEVNLLGDVALVGPLSDPHASSVLTVSSGSVRLPGGSVRLVPGGTLHFDYLRTFGLESPASLDVDLQGKTSITAIRYGQNTQRYDITVFITGDVLQDNGLHFDAISDPPDLAPDDVLALLGQKNLLESLGSADQSEAEARVRDALVGFALPSVLDPYTNNLAKNLGLDYISLEYNSVNLATLGVARSLNPDFTLQYRQQVGTPPPGYRAIYDFRLIFTPRRGPAILRRFSLSVGTDQDRPYKFALEYGTRFGGYSGPALKNKTAISTPGKP